MMSVQMVVCAFSAMAAVSFGAQEELVQAHRSVHFDTDSGICRIDDSIVVRRGPGPWFEFSSLELSKQTRVLVEGDAPLMIHLSGDGTLAATIDLSGQNASASVGGGGGGGAVVIWCGGNLTLGAINCRGGDGGHASGGGGGGGFVELLVDGSVDLLGEIDVSGGAGGEIGQDGEGGAVLIGTRAGVGSFGGLSGFRRALLRVPKGRVAHWNQVISQAEKDGRCPRWSVQVVEFFAPEAVQVEYLSDLRRPAKGASSSRAVPDIAWSFRGERDSIVECEQLTNFQLESQDKLRDCFPVSLLMTLNHLARLHQSRGGSLKSIASYEEVRWLTHESDMAKRLNGEGGMVHGSVALWASNVMAERMGLPWRFEARRAVKPEDLADALRWRLPLIVTTTKRVLSSPVVGVVNPVVATANLPGQAVSGTGRFIEENTGPLGFLGKPFRWVGDVLQPGKLVAAEDNVFTHYLHASVLVRVDLGRGIYRLADPWAGITTTGAAGFIDVSRQYLWDHFLNYQTAGFGKGRLVREWRELAPPGSYLIPVPH